MQPLNSQNSPTDAEAMRAILQTVGLCVRARKVALGTDASLLAMQKRQAKLVLVAGDAGANVTKKCRDKCAFYDIPVVMVGNRAELGQACGKRQVVVAAITDSGLAQKIAQLAEELCGGEAF